MNPLSDLERLVAAIEHQGANIAPTYQEYMPIAFATANDCGEAGRTFFHRICRLSEKYVYEEADKLYDHALKAGNGRCLRLAAGHTVQIEKAKLCQIFSPEIGMTGDSGQRVCTGIAELRRIRLCANAKAVQHDQKYAFCHNLSPV